ncbi:MAG: DUF4080 domain-containing protein [Spirochaetes bacterium]|nr:DUF4080 domain-containing protein [Spirochaetota bacterium]
MKLLITAVNSRFSHSNPAIRYLRNAAEPYIDEVEIMEYTVNQNCRDVVKDIVVRNPDAAAFSVYIWNAEFVIKLLKDLKKITPRLIITCGGPEVTFPSECGKLIQELSDFIILGQGESAFAMLAENQFESNEKIISSQNVPFSQIPFPYRDEDFKSLKNKFLYYESSRGCPFRCSYCLSSRDDYRVSYRKIEEVKSEIKKISENYTGTVKFVDRTFNASKKHSRDIWNYLVTLNDSNVYHFEIHPELLDDEDFEVLSRFPASKIRFELGIQSVHEKTLNLINRKSDMRKIERNILRLKKETEINLHADLIAGLPGENLKDISAGINFIMNLKPHQFQLGFLKILPGTLIHEQTQSFGIIFSESPPYTVYETDTINFSEMGILENIEHIIGTFYNTGLYSNIFRLLESSGDDWDSIFMKMSDFFASRKYSELSSGWAKNCMIMKDFVVAEYPHILKFFNDCARFDFFTNFYSTDYPDGLSDEFTSGVRVKMLQKIKNEYESNTGLSDFVKRNEFGKIMYFIKENHDFFYGIPDDVCLMKIRRASEIAQYSLLL